MADTTLLGLDDQPGILQGHGPITAVQARAIALGGDLYRLVVDPLSGTLLDLGRTRYRANQALVDYIVARDRCCRWPGCRRPANTGELDHQIQYNPGSGSGGTTSAKNLRSLCTRHHHLRHLLPWILTTNPDLSTTVRTPLGTNVTNPPPQPIPGRGHPLLPLAGTDTGHDVFNQFIADQISGSLPGPGAEARPAWPSASTSGAGPQAMGEAGLGARTAWRGIDMESYFAGVFGGCPTSETRRRLLQRGLVDVNRPMGRQWVYASAAASAGPGYATGSGPGRSAARARRQSAKRTRAEAKRRIEDRDTLAKVLEALETVWPAGDLALAVERADPMPGPHQPAHRGDLDDRQTHSGSGASETPASGDDPARDDGPPPF